MDGAAGLFPDHFRVRVKVRDAVWEQHDGPVKERQVGVSVERPAAHVVGDPTEVVSEQREKDADAGVGRYGDIRG